MNSLQQRPGLAAGGGSVNIPEGLEVTPDLSGINLFGHNVPRSTVAMVIFVFLSLIIFLVALFTGSAPVVGLSSPPLNVFSATLGWCYYLAWGLSFLPQLLVVRQPEVQVPRLLSLCLNILGYLCYLPYTLCFCFNKNARNMYKKRYNGVESNVALNDVLFAACALVFCLVDGVQVIRLDGERKKLKSILGAFFVVISIVTLTCFCLIGFEVLRFSSFNYLDFLFAMNLGKLIASIFKYLLQICVNYKRTKTMGRNKLSTVLDLAGGIISTVQELLDGYATGNWEGVKDCPVKSALGSVSVVVNIIFFALQFVAKYQKEHAAAEETQQ